MLKDKNLQKILLDSGYNSFYPIQEQAISNGLLKGKNLLITSPTASGKTLIAIMAALKKIENNQKVIYMTPLRSLATEKYHDFLELNSNLTKHIENNLTTASENTNLGKNPLSKKRKTSKRKNITVKLAMGSYDSTGRDLLNADIVILTNEKLDALIRNDSELLTNVGLFVIDEVHLIGDKDRGPTLEMMLTKIKMFYQEAQILGLSATVSNSHEISDWLGCKLITSNWRPTPLLEGVYDSGKVRMNNNSSIKINNFYNFNSIPVAIAIDSLQNGGQAIIFSETRKRAVSLATKSVDGIFNLLDKDQKEKAQKLSLKISKISDDTDITKNLISLVSKGVGFHHAGLNQSIREIVEDSFKEGIIKLLVATPTLAAGVNLPARRVVLSSILRYDYDTGTNIPISILEYKQFCGRAGRPKYDTFGEAIIIPESGMNSEELYDHYVLGTPEPVNSKLFIEKALRFHVLSTISTIPGMKKSELYDLFLNTLFAQDYRKSTVIFKIDVALDSLENWELVKSKNERYISTDFGKKTSVLYIDPLTAVEFKNALDTINKINVSDSESTMTQNIEDEYSNSNLILKFLHLISECSDFYPKLSLRKKDMDYFHNFVNNNLANDLLFDLNEYNCSRSFLALYEWINESSEKNLNDQLGVEPGDMHRMVESSDWLLYTLYEFAKLFKRNDILKILFNLRIRTKYGIKHELLPLIKLKGIGRIRARSLYNAGFSDIKLLKSAPESTLANISKIGPSIAKKIKRQLIEPLT
ncbi:MAG TPA: DEAD/DEAH box helicase [Nitrososphaeraceae archaeon]|nr:DEAD/DEAH box helicase [Nitrososphaeraceae archaeon]